MGPISIPAPLSRPRGYQLLMALFAAAFVLRLAYLIIGPGLDFPLEGDEPEYHAYASSLSESGEWSDGSAESGRPPTTPFIVSLVYLITGPDPTAARVLMVVISSFVPPAVFIVFSRLVGNRAIGLVAAAAFVIYPPAIYYSARILTENVASLLVVVTLGLFLWGAENRSYKIAVVLGIAWAAIALNRPVYLITPAIMLAAQIVLARFGAISWRWPRNMWVVALSAFLIALSPWIVRNYVAHGAFVPTTTQGGHLLLMTNGTLDDPRIRDGQYFRNPELYAIRERAESEIERDRVSRDLAFDELRANWRALPVPLLNRAKNFWTFRPDPYEPDVTRNDVVMFVIWIPTLALLLFGSFLRSWKRHWPAVALVFVAFAMTLPFWAEPRFRFPVDSILLLGAALGFVEALTIIGRRVPSLAGITSSRRTP